MTRTRHPRRSLRVEPLEDRRTPANLVETFSDPGNDPYWVRDGAWAIGPTAATSTGTVGFNPDPADDHSPTADNRVAGVVLAGTMPMTAGATGYIQSPWMDLTRQDSVTLSFWRWLNAPGTPFMKHTVEVFDGDKWNVIYQTGSADTADGAWTRQAFDLTPYLSKKFGVRFGYQVLQAGGPAVGGWNVDDIVVGQRPVAGDDQFQTAPETAFLIAGSKLTSNDSDPDGDLIQLTAIDARSAQGGTVTAAGKNYLYTPPAGFRGVDTFHYTLTEESGLSVPGTVRVVVGYAPVAAPDTYQVDPDGPLPFDPADLLTNDSDPDGNTIALTGFDSLTAAGGHILGAFDPRTGTVNYFYQPPAGFRGADAAHYTIADSTGLTARGVMNFLVGHAPAAADDAFDAAEAAPRRFTLADLLGNDTDPDGDVLTVPTFDARSAHGGSVVFDQGGFRYWPAAGYYGDDWFSYTAADPVGLTDTATVRLTVNGTPTAWDHEYATPEDTRLVVTAADGALADAWDPEGDEVTVTLDPEYPPAHGTVALRADGSFDYTPDPDFHGTDEFNYTVTDGHSTGTATVTLFVTSVPDAPPAPDLVPAADTGTRDDDDLTSARALAFDGTAEPGSTVTLYMDGVAFGSAVAAGGGWRIAVSNVPVGRRVFTVRIQDEAGQVGPMSAPLTVVVAAAPVARLAMASPAGGKAPLLVRVTDAAGSPLFDLAPGWKAADGVRIATGDLTGDGTADVAVTPAAGPDLGFVVAYDGVTGARLFRQSVFGAPVKLSIALGDVNGDGSADLVAAGLGGRFAGRVVGLSGPTREPLFDWPRAAGTTIHGVLAADADGDLRADVLVFQTQRPFGTDVVAYNAADRSEVRRYDGAAAGLTRTSRVAAGLVDGDDLADLIVSTGGKAPRVTVLGGVDGQTRLGSFAAPAGGAGPRAVAAADVNGDGRADVVIGAAGGRGANGLVRVTDLTGSVLAGLSLDPFGPGFHGTIEV